MRRAEEEKLFRKALKQFKASEDYYNKFHKNFIEDVKFSNADSDNGWQWPNDIYRNRQLESRPTLTINEIRVFNNLIINEIRKNPPSIVIRPTGGKASYDSAKIYSGLVREISRRSRALEIYARAARFQVDGGVGYWRVITEYENEMSFDQRITISSIRDMTSVFMDPDAKEPNGSDADYCFIFDDVDADKFKEEYPEVAKDAQAVNAFEFAPGWVGKGAAKWRVAEWFVRTKIKDKLVSMMDENGEEIIQYLSMIPEELRPPILDNPLTKTRPVNRTRVKWYKLAGHRIIEEKDWPGQYIPVCRAIGDEVNVEGTLDRKGNTRLLKDAQRMLNYWMSSGTEQLAMQGKTPWLVALAAIEGYETYYASANRINHAYLPFKHKDGDGADLPPPSRPTPPEMGAGYTQGMQIAQQMLAQISGQHEPQQGKEDNAQSGKAILFRKQAGETSTFHFGDNLASAVAHCGRIIIDITPFVYDTKRLVRIQAEDGEQSEVTLDPQSEESFLEEKIEEEENAKRVIFNPNIGRYDVEAEPGPDFTTQRQYAVDSLIAVLQANPSLWAIIGDIVAKNMDFPGAEEMAERIRRTIPKEVLGEGPDAETTQLQTQIEQLGMLLQNATQMLAEKELKLQNKDEDLTIKAVDADTRRIKELGNAQENFAALGIEQPLKALIMETIRDALGNPLEKGVRETDKKEMTEEVISPGGTGGAPEEIPPHPGAKKAPDGSWYVEHQPGQFAKVETQANGQQALPA